jgi:hypothetical protein
MTFLVGGALGSQSAVLLGPEGELLERAEFRVDCRTRIDDAGGRFAELLRMAHNTLLLQGETDRIWYEGRPYQVFSTWIRDHVHALKGLKYFSRHVRDAIDLFATSQREDGMVWDGTFGGGRMLPTDRGRAFAYGGFARPFPDGSDEWQRIPVENDVEYLYVEGIYRTWQATGDDAWMAAKLDSAVRAFEYATTDPYRYSTKYGLLKRGFTIDTWDYQPAGDEAITGHTMVVDKDRSRFGVMHGDNTGFAQSCRYLAQMLRRAGRDCEALRWEKLAADVTRRLNRIAWNGRFYTHHVPEDRRIRRDLGVDQDKQVSLSNAYALNRGATQEQCRAIIRTYQRIRGRMPRTSPAEWYSIYPPFRRGFEKHQPLWGYVNGGVLSIVAGELARGAFEHGFEDYGVDILERLLALARAHGGEVPTVLKGKMPEPPERHFTTVDISEQANSDLKHVVDLTGTPHGRRSMKGYPFRVPAGNGKGAMIALDRPGAGVSEVRVPVDAKATSLCVLHTMSGAASSRRVGTVALEYADGTCAEVGVYSGSEVLRWWNPERPFSRKKMPKVDVAFKGSNSTCPRFGLTVWGFDNPHPRRRIRSVSFAATGETATWCILGLTLCDAPHFMMPPDVSFGPVKWGAGAVTYGLIEGLAGVQDMGTAFGEPRIVPRWHAAGVGRAKATVRYGASDGYVAYAYRHDRARKRLRLTVTGGGGRFMVELLLPAGARPASATVDGQAADYTVRRIEKSRYVCVECTGAGVHDVTVELRLRHA